MVMKEKDINNISLFAFIQCFSLIYLRQSDGFMLNDVINNEKH